MADTRISALPAITAAETADADLLPIVDQSAGANRKMTFGEAKAALSVDAQAAQAAAEAAQAAAELAETNAETARDAAFVNADVYADTTAGLAAVALGEQFQVVSADGSEIIRYREDAGPVATEVARYPSADGVALIKAARITGLHGIPASGGLLGSIRSIVFTAPIEVAGDLTEVSFYATAACAGFIVVFDDNGTDYVINKLSPVSASTAGLVTVALPDRFTVDEGQNLGFWIKESATTYIGVARADVAATPSNFHRNGDYNTSGPANVSKSAAEVTASSYQIKFTVLSGELHDLTRQVESAPKIASIPASSADAPYISAGWLEPFKALHPRHIAIPNGWHDTGGRAQVGHDALRIISNWSESSLFANGENGAFFNFSELGSVFQDSGRTVPITAAGDPIVSVMDLSGNGFHLSATAGAVITLGGNPGKYYSSAVTGGFTLGSNTIDFSAQGEFWAWVVVDGGSTSTQIAIDLSAGSIYRFVIMYDKLFARPAGTTSGEIKTSILGKRVITARAVRATREVFLYVNGAEISRLVVDDAWFEGAQNLGLHVSTLGADGMPNSKIWSAGVLGRAITPIEHYHLVTLLASRAGVDLAGLNGRMVGSWSWFTNPSFIAVNSEPVISYTDGAGGSRVGLADDQGAITSAVKLGQTNEQDDHNNPSLLRRDSDGRLLSFFSGGHNRPEMYVAVSTNPNDASTWGAAADIASQLGVVFFAYPSPVQLLGEIGDPIYLFFRAATDTTPANWGPYYSRSIDGGVTWSTATRFVGGYRPYVVLSQNGEDRVDFIVSTGHPAETVTSLYHFYFTGGTFYSTEGTPLTLPIDLATMTPFWNGSTAAGRGWQWQVKIDSLGHPVVLFAAFPGATDHRYRYARWTGTEWVGSEICAAGGSLYPGEIYYSGGLCFDPDDLSVVFAARRGINGLSQIWRYETTDDGATWSEGYQLTSGDRQFLRPRCLSGVPEPRLLAMSGNYDNYLTFETFLELVKSI